MCAEKSVTASLVVLFDMIKKNHYAHLAERKIILRIPLGRGEFRIAKFFLAFLVLFYKMYFLFKKKCCIILS